MFGIFKGTSIVLVLILFTQAGRLQAQDTIRMTLQKCIEIALDENPTIRIDQKEIERTDYANQE